MEPEQKDNTALPTRQNVVLYIVRKTERIVSTTNILCDLITDKTEFVELLRKKTFPVLEAALVLRSSRSSGVEDTIVKIKDDLGALEVYLSTAALARCVSGMNARIVREEIFQLIDYIEEVTPQILAERSSGVHIGRGMFAVEDFAPPRTHAARDTSDITIQGSEDSLVARRHTKQQSEASLSIKDNYKGRISNDLYNDFYNTEQPRAQEARPNATPDTKRRAEWSNERAAVKQKSRRLDILSILQKKDKITIKDVAEVITDCSEKTLQRELLALVDSGVLKKEGERRWSTYSLA